MQITMLVLPEPWYLREGVFCYHSCTNKTFFYEYDKHITMKESQVELDKKQIVMCSPVEYNLLLNYSLLEDYFSITDFDVSHFVTQYERYIVFRQLRNEQAELSDLNFNLFIKNINDKMQNNKLIIPDGIIPVLVKSLDWRFSIDFNTKAANLYARIGCCLVPKEYALISNKE